LPQNQTLPAWKRWVGYTAQPRGKLVVDAGAQRAVQTKGSSLLAIGVVQVQGAFRTGEVVSVVGPAGTEFARGLSNYPSNVLDRILGLRTEQVREVLGTIPYEEVVHRDNLVVLSAEGSTHRENEPT
jgi:glutamate 5-kinase